MPRPSRVIAGEADRKEPQAAEERRPEEPGRQAATGGDQAREDARVEHRRHDLLGPHHVFVRGREHRKAKKKIRKAAKTNGSFSRRGILP